MKVVHVTSNLDPRRGGPVSALIGLARAQAKIGLEVSIVVNRSANSVERNALENLGVRFVDLASPLYTLRPEPKTLQVLATQIERAAVVHIHGVWEEPQHSAAVLARRLATPYLIRPCGMLDPWCLAQKRWKKKLYYQWRQKADLNGAAALHFTSCAERDGTSVLNLTSRALIEPNGLNLELFQHLPAVQRFRQRHLKDTTQKYLIFAGRLHPKKGLDILIPAFARSAPDDCLLCIAGPDEGGYRAVVENSVRSHGIENRVVFTGMLGDEMLMSALSGAELFVLSSYQENFGNAVIEALACGTPIIISDQVNIHPEIVAAQVGAVVPLNVEALAREITRWMSDNKLREAAAQRSRAFVWERYDWNHIAMRWKEHYQKLSDNYEKSLL